MTRRIHGLGTKIRANLVAWLALFVALGGTSFAASHYVITKTSQIKPSVLKQLHGDAGPRGPAGATGAAGLQGAGGPQGATGATGPGDPSGSPGPEGKAGSEGKAGTDGTTVVARARSLAPMVTTTAPDPNKEVAIKDYPLSSGTWTQGANEVNQLVGVATITVPRATECTAFNSESGDGFIELRLDGSKVGSAGGHTNGITTPTVTTTAIGWVGPAVAGSIFEPGSATSHTLTAKIGDDCGFMGGNSGGHFTINSISVDVLGAK
jgi:hypothetical protein